jgi:hypothetical protein
MSLFRGLGGQSGKEALLLMLLVAVTGAVVVLGVSLQLPSARQSERTHLREVEALLISIRHETARFMTAPGDGERQTQRDASAPADKRNHFSEDQGRKP